MKRIAVILTALTVGLVAAGSALAATVDTFGGSFSFRGSPGSKSKPAALSFKQGFTTKSKTKGQLPAVLSDIKVTVGNSSFDGGVFGKKGMCSAATITSAGDDTSCPGTAKVASGSIKATLQSTSKFTTGGTPCNPNLDVWYGGKGKLVFFFRTVGSHQCAGLQTGSVGPFTGSVKSSGGKLHVDIPVPGSVTHPVKGEAVAVTSQTLNWVSKSKGAKHTIQSIGCKGKRAYSYKFTAATPSGQKESVTTKGTAACG